MPGNGLPCSACYPQQALPLGGGGPALGGRPVDILGLDPEDRGKGAAGVPQHLGPEIGDPFPGPAGGWAPGPGREVPGGYAHVPTDSCEERLQGELRGRESGSVRHDAPQVMDELAAPQDPFVAEEGLPAPAEGGIRGRIRGRRF